MAEMVALTYGLKIANSRNKVNTFSLVLAISLILCAISTIFKKRRAEKHGFPQCFSYYELIYICRKAC